MSAGETVQTSSTGAKKAGNDERYDLIPAEPLRLLAQHYGRGAKKYESRNWEKGYEWSKSFAALNRHLWQFWAGEDVDPETGTPHTVAVMWHAAALTEYMGTHPEFDDRPSSAQAEPEVASGVTYDIQTIDYKAFEQEFRRQQGHGGRP